MTKTFSDWMLSPIFPWCWFVGIFCVTPGYMEQFFIVSGPIALVGPAWLGWLGYGMLGVVLVLSVTNWLVGSNRGTSNPELVVAALFIVNLFGTAIIVLWPAAITMLEQVEPIPGGR